MRFNGLRGGSCFQVCRFDGTALGAVLMVDAVQAEAGSETDFKEGFRPVRSHEINANA